MYIHIQTNIIFFAGFQLNLVIDSIGISEILDVHSYKKLQELNWRKTEFSDWENVVNPNVYIWTYKLYQQLKMINCTTLRKRKKWTEFNGGAPSWTRNSLKHLMFSCCIHGSWFIYGCSQCHLETWRSHARPITTGYWPCAQRFLTFFLWIFWK